MAPPDQVSGELRFLRFVRFHAFSLRRTLGAQLLQVFCCFDFFGDPRGLCFGQRFEFLLKSAHAGDAGATVADVVDYFVGSSEDFAGRAVAIRVILPRHKEAKKSTLHVSHLF